jgi:hypothetical protein
MSAFNFNLCDNSKCVSKNNITCLHDDGRFDFGQCEIAVGDSYENNCGGIGGFVGPEHEYFLYCGSKYAEIAVVKFDAKTDEWEDHESFQWFDVEDGGDDGLFEKIWFAKEQTALIFEPRKEYTQDLLAPKEFRNFKKNKAFIKFDFSTGTFRGITRKQFLAQRHSVLDENSEWPSPYGDSLSGDTLVEVPRQFPTHQVTVPEILERTRREINACLDELRTSLTDQGKPRRRGT